MRPRGWSGARAAGGASTAEHNHANSATHTVQKTHAPERNDNAAALRLRDSFRFALAEGGGTLVISEVGQIVGGSACEPATLVATRLASPASLTPETLSCILFLPKAALSRAAREGHYIRGKESGKGGCPAAAIAQSGTMRGEK